MRIYSTAIIFATALTLTACGTHKAAVATTQTVKSESKTIEKDVEKEKIDYLDKVNSNASYQKNIVAGITFTASSNGGKEISVPGQLRMRRDQVIRLSLQMPIIGTEVGRIEFTPDNVLFVDRIHKEYVKASYSQVSFLKENGISFYTLQALFWNRLYLPGKTSVGYTDLSRFTADPSKASASVPVTITDGKLTYTWTTERSNATISKAKVDYKSSSKGVSTLQWDYSDFRTFGSKPFPYTDVMTITTPATGKTNTLKATFQLGSISTASDWETTTTLSNKYKEVSVEDILGKLMRH